MKNNQNKTSYKPRIYEVLHLIMLCSRFDLADDFFCLKKHNILGIKINKFYSNIKHTYVSHQEK